MKKVLILGSTGSIGRNALDVISKLKGFKVVGLAAHSNIKLLLEQAYKFNSECICVFEETKRAEIKKFLSQKIKLLPSGVDGLNLIIEKTKPDILIMSLTGAVGLIPLITALKYVKRIGIANKEPMVIAGDLIIKEAKKYNVELIPIDSEPSAIFQSLASQDVNSVNKIILTASGGPFYNFKGDFSKISPEKAVKHPRWKMGKKISVDSATLMNKGLEAIEIKNFFSVDISKIQVVIHPESIIHSAVEYLDGSVIAQMSNPDMRLPIQYALTYPQRYNSPVKKLNLFKINSLHFYNPDFSKFPCLKLAFDVAKLGGLYPAILNASDEIAVSLFLERKISFTDIYKLIHKTVESFDSRKRSASKIKLEDIIEADMWAREKALSLYKNKEKL